MTGQLFIRDTGQKSEDGRKLVIVTGILALNESDKLKCEHQYTVQELALKDPVDLTRQTRGMTVDGLLTSPMWRV